MFSQKFISIRLKGLAKLNTFIIALCIAKKKTQYIAYEYTDIAYQGTEEKADDGDTSGTHLFTVKKKCFIHESN